MTRTFGLPVHTFTIDIRIPETTHLCKAGSFPMKRLWARLQSKTRRETSDASRRPLSLKALALRQVSLKAGTIETSGLSAVHVVCASGRADCLESILKSRKKLKLNAHSRKVLIVKRQPRTGSPWVISWSSGYKDRGMTPLHLAVVARSTDCVRLLLTQGAEPDVMAGDFQEETPLDYACLLGEVDIMRLLLDYGAEVNHCPLMGQAPIHYVLSHCDKESVQLLLERGADPNISAARDVTALLHFSLGPGAYNFKNMRENNRAGDAPLHYAAVQGQLKTVELLLKSGADAKQLGRKKRTALHYAAAGGWVEVVSLLINGNAPVSPFDSCGNTPLHLSTRGAHSGCLRLLLEHGADPNVSTLDNTPLHLSVKCGHYCCTRLLLEHGADPNVSTLDNTPLHLSVKCGHYCCSRLLLEHGADPNAIESDRDASPLMYAIQSRAPVDYVKLLVSKGADVNYSYDCFVIVPNRGCGYFPSYTDIGLLSVFDQAIMWHGPDILRILLASDANASCIDEEGNTKLIKACISINHPSPKVTAQNVQLLVFVKGMDLNHCHPGSGRTALHMCAVNGLTDASRVLLEAGANPFVVNNGGLTPYNECKSEETRAVFQEYAG